MSKESDYRNSWIAANRDRINLTVPKGRKEELAEYAAAQDHSVNSFINAAITEKIEADREPERGRAMRIYTIVGGVNGAGKSSFTGVLKEIRKDLGRIINVDKITARLGGDPLKGGRESIRRIDDCLKKGISFTQETTLSGFRTERTAKAALEGGYLVRLYYVGLNTAQESLDRIANRVRRGGHSIPQSDVLRRFDGRWESVGKVLPYCSEAEFYDNDNGFVKVGEYQNGELILMGEHRPAWILELKQYLEHNG